MRPTSRYLIEIKNEKSHAQFNLAGTTPPTTRRTNWKIAYKSEESARSPILKDLKDQIARLTGALQKEIAVTPGSAQALLQVLAALTHPGDTVLIERPCYEPFVAAAKFLGLKVVHFKRTGNFQTDYSTLKTKIRGIKAILISNPHCPMGWLYSAREIQALAALGKPVIVDEVYLPHFANRAASLTGQPLKNIISISGLSKTLGLSNLRLGWVKATSDRIVAVDQIGYHFHVDMPLSPLQFAGLALKNWSSILNELEKPMEVNRARMREFERRHPGTLSHNFETGNFVGLRIPKVFRSGKGFAAALLNQSVAVRAGEEFGAEKYVRMNIMLAPKEFSKALAVIENYYG